MAAMTDPPEWRWSRPAGRSQFMNDAEPFPSLDAGPVSAANEKGGRRREIGKLPALY